MKKNYLFIFMIFVTSLGLFFACKPEPEPQTTGSIKVTTSSVSNITETSAKCGGTVTASAYSVGNCGLCYSETPNPTIDSYITSDLVGTGSFTSIMSGLEPGTKYYVRAYATTDSDIFYGKQKEFTTLGNGNGGNDDGDDDDGNGNDNNEPTTGTINGHEWVDLGLPSGLKWATCNVGASSPEDYDNYYAWGETETKSTYTSDNCATYGVQMNDISGNAQYDVARKNWGGSWRMPTRVEMEELVEECALQWTIQNGVNGCKVTGPNGNHIFLPAAGYRYGSSLYDAGEHGSYWSSTPYEGSSLDAYGLGFGSSGQGVDWYGRNRGRSVRPVSE